MLRFFAENCFIGEQAPLINFKILVKFYLSFPTSISSI
ncbi:hypothetical protein CHAB381_0044 [Campylobacter hominis ATCC BAA-381]|uniref:Uncharacterized protein n=1 Tax=Campylobacter hominis (strain ATCC BAA-381 / DSM 21671 / CCUG 45161 / LMG 19568 / NCTC 13146 / CH001A) TaxID=360107 RepID=A7HZH5_CAMHC|nr:hypothetical protein CHAB381_0044 [Campylobacter hominis ATCC BAA-381]